MKRRFLTLCLITSIGCETGELTGSGPGDDDLAASRVPAECIGRDGHALGENPPVFSLADIGFTLQALGQIQAAVTPYVAKLLPPEPLFGDGSGRAVTNPDGTVTLGQSNGFWTNWYRESDMRLALAKLGVMRGILDRINLWDLYLAAPGAGTMPAVAPCGPETLTQRRADGSCNDLSIPAMGARQVRFGRNIMPFLGKDATTGLPIKNPAAQSDMSGPSPREISRHLFTRQGAGEKVPFLNMLAAAWIQFQVHDWFDHGENDRTSFFTIPLAADDPIRKKTGQTALLIPRTRKDASRTLVDAALGLPPTFQNDVTHWWDASQIYGSDEETARRLREGVGGRLKLDERGLLPKAPDGFDDTGMRRNWWIGLAVMHNLFAREHNAIADMLAQRYPDWTDEQIYQKARLINAALIVKIHTVEWTPAILPNKTLEVGMNANWYGLERFIDWTPATGFQKVPLPPETFKAAFGIPDAQWPTIKPIIYGVAGGQRDLKVNPTTGAPVPFTLTEEFVSVYRMHALLPNSFPVYSLGTGAKLADYEMPQTRDAGARAILESYSLADLLFSMGTEHPNALTLFNYPRFLQELRLPIIGAFDMGTVDILRDRERGIPKYNEFRRQLRLKPIPSIDELTPDPAARAALKKVYGSDPGAIDRVDALVGTLAEGTRPDCYGFGETLFQVFTVMATRRIQADRFYTDDYRPEVYTPEGIAWIESNSLKTVLLRHHPELASTGLAEVANAFFPWD